MVLFFDWKTKVREYMISLISTAWTSTSLWSDSGNYAVLYVNQYLRLCRLRYYRGSYNFNDTSEHVLNSSLIPSDYRPKTYSVVAGCWNPNVSLAIDPTGNIVAFARETGSKAVNGSVMWNY